MKRHGITLNDIRHEVHEGKTKLMLAPKEYEILKLLMTWPGKVFSREELLSRIWGITVTIDTRVVDQHVARLRRKIKTHLILTVRSYGYQLKD